MTQRSAAMVEPRTTPLAFLDLDGSLLRGNTFHLWCRHLLKTRPEARIAIVVAYALRALRILSSERFREAGLRAFRGRGREELDVAVDTFVERELTSRFRRAGLEFVQRLRREGVQCVLLTGALEPIASACARYLRVADVHATGIEISEGLVTGRLAGPELRGVVKRDLLLGLGARGVALGDCLGVGDDREDLLFLELLGRRILVNWAGRVPPGEWERVAW